MANSVTEGGAFYRARFRSRDMLINTEFNWVNQTIGSFDLPLECYACPGSEEKWLLRK
jgi:hypothetical protein